MSQRRGWDVTRLPRIGAGFSAAEIQVLCSLGNFLRKLKKLFYEGE